MRKIKFRAWCKIDKIMYYGVESGIKFDDQSYYEFHNFLGDQRLSDYHEWELMQCTGLKDKSGKEIYEGDILRPTRHAHVGEIVEVKWNDEKAKFEGLWKDDESILDLGSFHPIEQCLVIGNIYENPGLI